MKYSVICLISVLALNSCSDVETIENKTEEGVLVEKYSRKKDNFAKHGPYQSFHENGQVYEERFFKEDQLDGISKVYLENGKLDYLETHKNGQYEGLYQKYYENGQLSNEGQYVDNEMSGVWKRWYKDGTLREEVHFKGNEENGPFKEFHENGKLKTEGIYLNGDNEQGELLVYDEAGALVEKKICEYGVCGTIWNKGEGDQEVDLERIKQLAEMKRKADIEE